MKKVPCELEKDVCAFVRWSVLCIGGEKLVCRVRLFYFPVGRLPVLFYPL